MMKKYIALVLSVLLLVTMMVGCGGSAGADVADDAAVQGITDGGASPSEEEIAMLQEVFGLSEEEIAAYREKGYTVTERRIPGGTETVEQPGNDYINVAACVPVGQPFEVT